MMPERKIGTRETQDQTRLSVRPWGVVRLLVRNQRCSVDWTTANRGGVTSLHSHRVREELWVMLDEGAEVVVGDEVLHPDVGEQILMKAGVKHRLINNTDHPIQMIAISFGEWAEEDQIRREDAYGRKGQPVKF